jgi:hypothetical protein
MPDLSLSYSASGMHDPAMISKTFIRQSAASRSLKVTPFAPLSVTLVTLRGAKS